MSAPSVKPLERITKLLSKAHLSTKSLDPTTYSIKESQPHKSEPQSPKPTQINFVDRSAEFKDEFVSIEESMTDPSLKKAVDTNFKEKHYMKKEKVAMKKLRFIGLKSDRQTNEKKAQAKMDYLKIANGLVDFVEKEGYVNSTHNIFNYGDCQNLDKEIDLYTIDEWFTAERLLKEIKHKINEFGNHVDELYVPKDGE